ncbi:zinc finger (C3HC4 RING finger) protein, putative [Eimeria mitis]|uniref:RING-type E3 ubiquitin transferase n=1 Tax=Eimeria mitis TaxID=44415 RepID=U6JYE3_9EIME|nr:zinc finger (C3HC4 RING finger) protein, putative [Eimeria mitis]CDJ30495.1 zinc finger (C3HC4 RING finger) protein, putative [Eimeria mitis]
MGEGLWIPFDVRIMELLESLWAHLQGEHQQDGPPDALPGTLDRTQEPHQPQHQQVQVQQHEDQGQEQGEDREGEEEQNTADHRGERASQHYPQNHKLYVHLLPWRYCLDLHTMTQKNLATHRVRPIRRMFERVGLWFSRGTDGYAERFAPELEIRLESLWQESRDGRRSPGPLAIAWQDPSTGDVHYTDVIAMNELTGNGSYREIMRMEISCVTQDSSLDAREARHLPELPSLEVGNEESGEAFCRGHKEWFDSDDFQAAFAAVGAGEVPDDACAICLETFGAGDSVDPQELQREEQQKQASARPKGNSASRSVSSYISSSSGDSSPTSSSSSGTSGSSSNGSSASSKNSSSSGRGASTQQRQLSACVSEGCSEVDRSGVIDCDGGSTSKSNLMDEVSSNQEVVKLRHCPHHFHSECIRMYMQRCSRGGFFCPTCNVLQLPGNGPSPPGKMSWRISRHSLLAGHPREGTIIIEYVVEGGIQTERHAHPNTPFTGTRRQAFLPDCLLGRQLLRLLIRAFVKGHTFTVGDSVTSGQSNVVVWNGIHHKTSVSGGLLRYGYPDDTFLLRLAEELRARGFPLERAELNEG